MPMAAGSLRFLGLAPWVVVLLVGVLVPGVSRAGETGETELGGRVAGLLRQLDAEDFRTREAAAKAVEELPVEALPLLEGALAKGDLSPEVSIRLNQKVDLLRRKATSYDYEVRRELEWNRADTLAAYDRGGHTNPKWDAAAREALVLYVRPRFDPNRSPKDDRRILAAFGKALELGCDDPFFLYGYANRYRLVADHDPAKLGDLLNRAAEGMVAGHYTLLRKLMALGRRAAVTMELDRKPLSAGARRDALRDLDAGLALLPEAAAQTPARGMVYDAANLLYDGYRTALDDPDAALAKVLAVLRGAAAAAAAVSDRNVAALFEADTRLALADLLKDGNNEYARRFKGKEDEVALARHRAAAKGAIDAAAKANPSDPLPLNAMLAYLDNTGADAGRFEDCFAAAMEADPSNLRACQLKLGYLRRHGAEEAELIAFGRQCLAGANWSSRIPFIVADVYGGLARFDRPEEYFARPEVWEDVRNCYEGYLRRYPNAVFDRSNYAQYACWAGQWGVAKAEFDKLGDEAVPGVFRGRQTMEYLRRKAGRMAGAGK